MKQIPTEGKAFRDMDGSWRGIMQGVRADPLMLHVADTQGLLEELQHCNAALDIVEKGERRPPQDPRVAAQSTM
jgi:dynein heavy chain, axonemal